MQFKFYWLFILRWCRINSDLNDYVWYFAYGSNVSKERFLCYVRGGQPKLGTRVYSGCRNKAFPLMIKPSVVRHELYFAKNSRTWESGGVAFLANSSRADVVTYGRLYLITKQQLCDVAQQEAGSDEIIEINFQQAIDRGHIIFKQRPAWYGNAVFLGMRWRIPIFTLTNEVDLPECVSPAGAYLRTISDGLVETHRLDKKQIAKYFMRRSEVARAYPIERLGNFL